MNDKQPILVVQDNPDEVDLTVRALKKNKVTGEVVVVGDGEEAIDYLFGTGAYAGRDTNAMPKMVLLDLKLPRIDGKEVLERLRADERTKSLPVVILASSKDDREVMRGYKMGTNFYINKPVDFKEFSEEIGKVVHTSWQLQTQPTQEEGKKQWESHFVY